MNDESIHPEINADEQEPAHAGEPMSEGETSATDEVIPNTEDSVNAVSAADDTAQAAEPPFALEPKPVPAPAHEPKKAAAKEKEEASQSPFSVTVGLVYDGPLDLLLDLIRKQNIDIYDIPIAKITSQFLDYTHHLKGWMWIRQASLSIWPRC